MKGIPMRAIVLDTGTGTENRPDTMSAPRLMMHPVIMLAGSIILCAEVRRSPRAI